MIDLDDENVAYRDELAERIADLQLFFYLVFSGKKGYQFWIFWDRDLPHEELLQLQAFLCEDIPHDTNVWPYKRSLIKLPLGLHQKTQHLACLVPGMVARSSPLRLWRGAVLRIPGSGGAGERTRENNKKTGKKKREAVRVHWSREAGRADGELWEQGEQQRQG